MTRRSKTDTAEDFESGMLTPPPIDTDGNFKVHLMIERLWPLRKLPDSILEMQQRISGLEHRQGETTSEAISSEIKMLRLILIGDTGVDGIVGGVNRDIANLRGESAWIKKLGTWMLMGLLGSALTISVFIFRTGQEVGRVEQRMSTMERTIDETSRLLDKLLQNQQGLSQ